MRLKFLEERAQAHKFRDDRIYSTGKVPLRSKDGDEERIILSLQEAIEILQRNERGRQGRGRALLVKELQ